MSLEELLAEVESELADLQPKNRPPKPSAFFNSFERSDNDGFGL